MADAARPRSGALVAVPLYNHVATVRSVVEGVLALGLEVVVVDDGSTDGGAETLAGLPVRVLRHETNRGKGAALLTAAAEGRRLGMTHLVTLDADGQHDPAEIPRFLEALQAAPGAIFVGKRNFEGTHAPGSSRFGRSFSNFWMRLQTGLTVGDMQSGFRAYPLAVLEELTLRERQYAFEVEVLVKAAWAGVEVRDVPISVYYAPGKERVSHFRLFRDNARLTALNTRLTMRAFLPWPHRKLVEVKGPTVSLLHPLRSLRELLTENSSPGKLAAAGALGVFLGALPLIMCQTVVILIAACYLRVNRMAALSTAQLCFPPFVPALCIEAGYFVRHGRFLTELTLDTIARQGLERIYEWLIGSLLLGPVLAALLGAVIYGMAVFVSWGCVHAPEAAAETPEGQAWSSRSVGSRLQHGVFYALIRLGGRRAAYGLLRLVVAWYTLFSASAREKASHYLRRRFPGRGAGARLVDTYRLLLGLGQALVDRAVVGILGLQAIGVVLRGREEVLQAAQEGRGLIVVTAHVGCWQVAMSALAFFKRPVSMLVHREDGDVDRQYFEHAGVQCPYRVIDPRGYLGGTLEMIGVLKRGEVLCIMGDRVLGSQRNVVNVDFLGESAPFPYSAFKIASTTGAPVAVLLSHKTGPASYVLEASRILRVPEDLGRSEERIRPYVAQFVEVLEAYAEKHPYQFFNFYDLWAGAGSDAPAAGTGSSQP